MKKVLFIDRDGTLVIEPPVDYQLDSLEKLEFYPKVMRNLGFVRSKLDFEFVMVTNQDGLGTASFPEETFWPAHNLMMKTLEGEGVTFDDICIDRSMPEDNAPTRKPRTGMLTKYLGNPDYDLVNSFVIGDLPVVKPPVKAWKMSVHWLPKTGIRWQSSFLPVRERQRCAVSRKRRIFM